MDYNFFDFNLGLVNEGNLVIKGNLMNHYCLFITADPIPVTVSDPVLINRIFTNVPLDSNIARLLKLTEVAGGGNVVRFISKEAFILWKMTCFKKKYRL
jgi:hypothetical protein